MATACAALLTSFSHQVRHLAAQFAAVAFINFNPEADGGPYLCHYQLAGHEQMLATCGAHTPEDALEDLHDCLWQAQQDRLLLSRN